MTKTRAVVCSIGIIALGATSACGSSSTSGTAAAGTNTASASVSANVSSSGASDAETSGAAAAGAMTKADYIVQADAICKASKDADTAAGSAPSDPTTATAAELPALGAYFAKATPIVANEVSKLDALAKPAADSAALTGMLAKVSDLAAQYQAAGDAATSGDLTAFQTAITTLSADGAAANTVAAGYGLKVCGT